ncbi:hypothetical protein [Streptomyces silvisoli]|uniref:Uncharacterized protein n=1 Tax=Streptomyces silvisoli TaxID=3034235 RepID=A0ABT5ZLP4_9ACTN|nr:hypothetical protein [Streptomyces silvisoli]MDF3290745.1 hypothetical protein [Streptomyces silvisoli]
MLVQEQSEAATVAGAREEIERLSGERAKRAQRRAEVTRRQAELEAHKAGLTSEVALEDLVRQNAEINAVVQLGGLLDQEIGEIDTAINEHRVTIEQAQALQEFRGRMSELADLDEAEEVALANAREAIDHAIEAVAALQAAQNRAQQADSALRGFAEQLAARGLQAPVHGAIWNERRVFNARMSHPYLLPVTNALMQAHRQKNA